MPESDAPGSSDVDPVTLEVARNACAAVAEEMNATLVRTAYSPNVTERRDCSCAVFDADGALVAQAENIPVHLGAMPFSVAAALEAFPGDELAPGDAVLLNDPFRGGAHLPDLTLVTPVFADGAEAAADPLAFVANRAHHADIGGSQAGGVAADSTEIYQEGLRIPPVKLYDGGDPNEAVFDTVLANVRTPEERRGDLRAQVAANETGVERYRELAQRHGDDLPAITAAIQNYAERRTRAEIRDLPNGEYAFDDVLDDDGLGTEKIRIEATVTVNGDAITVDFEGTDPQTRGPVNAVFAVTASATYYAVRCVTDPDVPPNAGAYRPVEVRAPEGTVVNPEPPAAVVGGNLETSQRVTDVVLGALAECAPERAAAAGQGTMNNITFGGADPREGSGDGGDRAFAFYETGAGGSGAHAAGDGMDGVHVHMSNTLNTPVEVLETAYPLRVHRYALRPDSGGAGQFRGGLGLRRDIEVRGETQFSLLADRHRSQPYGLAGGDPGESGAAFLTPADAEESDRLPPKTTLELSPGDLVSIRSPGGGGYGDPSERARAAIERDLRLGKVTTDTARARYGYDQSEDSEDE